MKRCEGSGEVPVVLYGPEYPETGFGSTTVCPGCPDCADHPGRCEVCGGNGYVLDPKPGDPLSGGDSKPCPNCSTPLDAACPTCGSDDPGYAQDSNGVQVAQDRHTYQFCPDPFHRES
jgi:hypothetical protein